MVWKNTKEELLWLSFNNAIFCHSSINAILVVCLTVVLSTNFQSELQGFFCNFSRAATSSLATCVINTLLAQSVTLKMDGRVFAVIQLSFTLYIFRCRIQQCYIRCSNLEILFQNPLYFSRILFMICLVCPLLIVMLFVHFRPQRLKDRQTKLHTVKVY